MGTNQGTDRRGNQEANGETKRDYKEYIDLLYDEGLKVELTYKDMYDMDLYELTNAIEQKKKFLAYKIWRLASLTRSPFVKEFPQSPEEAMPELMPHKQGIEMPDFLKEKYYKRKGVKMND